MTENNTENNKDNVVTIKNITKKYESRVVLSDISMSLNKGQSVALIGNNGSGKSTFLKIIGGLTGINEGEISYGKKNLRINYLPENFPRLNMSAIKYINYVGAVAGLSQDDIDKSSHILFESFNLQEVIDKSMRSLSKGNLQKVGAVQALISKPDILLLDEPMSGQDVDSQEAFIDFVKGYVSQGVVVVMASHDKHIISNVSNMVFEIKDSKFSFVPMRKNSVERKYDTMIFINPHNSKIPEDVIRASKRVSNDGNIIKIVSKSEISNDIVGRMIYCKFVLRGMYGDE